MRSTMMSWAAIRDMAAMLAASSRTMHLSIEAIARGLQAMPDQRSIACESTKAGRIEPPS